jgi:coenzyme F420-0:L-glutamate ligase / coenzyme F420-1:gamma-L-glutamate ligase
MSDLQLIGISGIPEIKEGDHLADLVAERAQLQTGDVVVIASKIVAKAEGQVIVATREDAPRLIDEQSVRILRTRGETHITETIHGFICANAGIDWSNVEAGHAVLLPRDSDRSAFKIRERLRAKTNAEVGVIISDTFGRAWRNGLIDVALGSSGIKPVVDLRGTKDHHGNALRGTQICIADELASAAELVMGKARRIPAVVVRGVDPDYLGGNADVQTDIIRKPADDWFR